jgi:predicted glycoside hydrolase/deacetylase ChbG (UPF0249 family)
MTAMQVARQRLRRTGRRIGRDVPVWAALAALGLCAAGSKTAGADTWAERLGFPAGAKVILLHSYDLGMCYETNSVGTRLLASGAVRSASVMVPCPWFGDFARWNREHPDADIGVDLTLNSEWQNYRWQPVAPRELVRSLVDADGFLWQTPVQTMVNASAEQVEQELLAQIARAKEAGIRPTHLTTHLGTLVSRPDLMEVYLRIAREQWIPAMIVELTPEQVERFRSRGFPLPDDVIAMLNDYPLPKVDDLRFVPVADSYEKKKQLFLTMFNDLSPGITQIAFHPAAESDALPRIMPEWQQRVWDAQLAADGDVRQVLQADGVILTDWRELMRRFEGRPALAEEPKSSSSSATQ